MNSIPSVDLSKFLSDDPQQKQQFVNKIGNAYEEIGFVALKGHFLSEEFIGKLYNNIASEEFLIEHLLELGLIKA